LVHPSAKSGKPYITKRHIQVEDITDDC